MKILIVTGGIGSGKSSVCKMLNEIYGVPVYEADLRAKSLYSEIPQILEDIEEELSVCLRNESGEFSRKKLADIIFTDRSALQKVEEILFPYLTGDFADWAARQGKEVVAFESATVLEKPQFEGFGDIVLLVDAPLSLRVERACLRDGGNELGVMERINAQPLMNRLSEGETCDRVDHTLINDGDLDKLSEKLRLFIEESGLTKML